ncbi:hypothetical protein KI387_022263, partial [Taxus chinensis]
YSGDWSRIGVISKEIEAILKMAAYFIVPLSVGLIFYSSRNADGALDKHGTKEGNKVCPEGLPR